jgi:hypothetical protein
VRATAIRYYEAEFKGDPAAPGVPEKLLATRYLLERK